MEPGRTSGGPNDMRHTLGFRGNNRTDRVLSSSLLWSFRASTVRSGHFDPALISTQRGASVLQMRWVGGNASIVASAVLVNRVKRVEMYASDAPEADASGTAHISGPPAALLVAFAPAVLGPVGWSRRALSVCAMRLDLRTAHDFGE
jgi:hypothetical protein